MRPLMAAATLPLVIATLGVLAACGSPRDGAERSTGSADTGGTATAVELPEGGEPARLNPSDFTSDIDNPYWPMAVGSRWVYRETDGEGSVQRVVVTVTGRTRRVAGVAARVVHDTVTEDGEMVEDTYDWYAQDREGNVWYLGEETKEYEGGKVVTTAGSWEAGVDGAEAGIAVPANPRHGLTYRQEHLEGEAEDSATVLGIDEKAQVPFGRFSGVLLTKDFTPLEPDLVEYKFYARDVGPILVVTVSGGRGREELVSFASGA